MDETISKRKNREQAFQVWYAHSQNDSETVRELQKLGFSVTRQTISDWKKKYCWQERAAAIDNKKIQAIEISLTFEETLIEDLKRQKVRYDAYFDALPVGQVDNQAMYVYNQLCEKLISLTSKIKPRERKERRGLDEKTANDIKAQILGIKE